MRNIFFTLMMICLGCNSLHAQKRIAFLQAPGMMHGPQIGLQNALKAEGYIVDTSYAPFDWETLTGYDLVIVSRATSSGQFMDAVSWNALDVPVMVLNSWCVRDPRMRLINADVVATDTGGQVSAALITKVVPIANGDATYDSIFIGVSAGGAAFTYVKWFYDYLNYYVSDFTADMNTGKPLVMLSDSAKTGAGAVMMARWEPGKEAYPGSGIHVNYRTYMNIGADDNSGLYFNMDSYTDASLKLFLNEVSFLLRQKNGCVPPSIITQPQRITRAVGASATFSIVASGSGRTYQWKKAGTDIPGATSASYTIDSVTGGDAASYSVVINGACGSPVSSSGANLVVSNLNGYIIQGETFIDTTSNWSGVNIERTIKKSFYFLNNSITAQGEGYMLQAGDEMPGPTNNNLDSSIITGNKFIWNGNDSIINEAMFMGYNINNEVKYNYLKGAAYAICSKSSGMTCTSGCVANNIVINAMLGAGAKGINGVRFFNNTFYSNRTIKESRWKGQIQVYTNDDAGSPGFASTNCKIFNNIFYTKYQIYNIIVTKDCLSGFECDYNIYYCEAGTPLFLVGSDTKTFADWQAMGYDKHSIVINPNFIINTLIPSVPLYIGKNLGDEWKQGLSPSAEWGTTSPALANQDSSIWQCGAYVVSQAPVADHYLAPYGNDSNSGTISSPFFSLNKLAAVIKAGQLAYLRGGTYGFSTQQIVQNLNGTSSSPINIFAYPGETPILTKSGADSRPKAISIYNNNYVHFKGIEIAGFSQTTVGELASALWIENSNNCTFELINYHNNGCGIILNHGCNETQFINCDSHNNYDPYTLGIDGAYGNADGFDLGGLDLGTTSSFKNCRSWGNSDDGFDCYRANGLIIFQNCWSFHQGYRPDGVTTGGDGWGFKLGISTNIATNTTLTRKLTNCLAFYNREGGIGLNDNTPTEPLCNIFNCTTFHNLGATYTAGFDFGDVPNIAHVLQNNIAFDEMLAVSTESSVIENHNTWDDGFSVSSSDFLSLDSTGMSGPRQPDGNLPKLDFLKLAPSSNLIDAGVDVGMVYYGTAPDIGAFETGGPLAGISKLKNNSNGYLIYPNPVENILQIEAQNNQVNISLSLFDETGTKLIESNSRGNSSIDFSNYAPGIYFLRAISEGKTSINKIIKY
jgi:hypothetical protein